MAVLSEEPLVAAVVRLDDKRRELAQELVAEQGTTSALSTELAAQRAALATSDAKVADLQPRLDKCQATRQWLNDRVAQLEAAMTAAGVPIPAAPTPKP